ncbi:unnamed protein product, partial [Mesorhabditis spiculigera]
MADVKVDSSDSDQDPKKKRAKNSRNTKAIHSASDQSSDEEVAPPPKKAARGRPRKSVTRHDSDSDEEQRRPVSDKKKMERNVLNDLVKKRNAKLKRDETHARDEAGWDSDTSVKSTRTSSSKKNEDNENCGPKPSESSKSKASRRSSSESSTNTRARSPTPEEEEQGTPIEKKADIMKALLTRSTLLKLLKTPFFATTVKDCLVRVNVELPMSINGVRTKVGIVLDDLETETAYPVRGQQINKVLRVQFAKVVNYVRFDIISDRPVTDVEFLEWKTILEKSNLDLPNIEQVARKGKEIKDALCHIFTDTEVEQMIKERRRFEQKTGKFATEKRWLMNQKEALTKQAAQLLERARQIELQLERLESPNDESEEPEGVQGRGIQAAATSQAD